MYCTRLAVLASQNPCTHVSAWDHKTSSASKSALADHKTNTRSSQRFSTSSSHTDSVKTIYDSGMTVSVLLSGSRTNVTPHNRRVGRRWTSEQAAKVLSRATSELLICKKRDHCNANSNQEGEILYMPLCGTPRPGQGRRQQDSSNDNSWEVSILLGKSPLPS